MMQIIVAELVGIITQTYSGCLPGSSGSVTFSHLRHVLVRPALDAYFVQFSEDSTHLLCGENADVYPHRNPHYTRSDIRTSALYPRPFVRIFHISQCYWFSKIKENILTTSFPLQLQRHFQPYQINNSRKATIFDHKNSPHLIQETQTEMK